MYDGLVAYADPDRRRAYAKEWYAKNKEARKARVAVENKERRKRIKQYIDNLKNVPCADCGESFDTVCMDFDHVQGEKLFTIATEFAEVGKRKLEEELAKCEVVCANCHRIRTRDRRAAMD